MTNTVETEQAVREHVPDPLRPARGLVFGLLLAGIFWTSVAIVLVATGTI